MIKKIPTRNKMRQLSRIAGQVDGVKKMVEEGRSYTDILVQLRSIRSSVKIVEAYVIAKILEEKMDDIFSSKKGQDKKIEELKKVFLNYGK